MRKFPRRLRIFAAAVSFLLTLAAFTKGCNILPGWLYLQFGAAFAKLFAYFSVFTLLIVCITAASAFIFGRFYCSVICPFGILQDIISFFNPKKKKSLVYNFKKTRYAIAAVSVALLISGWAFAFMLLDPYSNFGRIAASLFNPVIVFAHNIVLPSRLMDFPASDLKFILASGFIHLFILSIIVVVGKRFFCTALCPVGTILGLFSKKAVFSLEINKSKCVSCGLCSKNCPSACIDIKKDKFLDNETCVRCMNCVSVCPVKAVNFNISKNLKPAPPDLSKRTFLIGGFFTAAAFGTGIALKPTASKAAVDASNFIVPPGALSQQRFAAKCTACLACVANCSGKVLKFSGKHKPVHLEFDKGFCEYNCHNCSDVCPAGALEKMTIEEKRLCRIGLAELELTRCVTVTDGTECGACAEQCPTGALQMQETNGARLPYFINKELCIGCGSCENACPVRPSTAVWVNPIALQLKAEHPADYFRKIRENSAPVQEESASDEWGF
ncbi:MAG: 4Fe-4S binding protein [Endomicrobium sp.]|jgi:ferredoxin|nr:4Fe-4S binding protein [Endomicrobium sp.]